MNWTTRSPFTFVLFLFLFLTCGRSAAAQCPGTQNISWTEITNASPQANGGITSSAAGNYTSAFASQQLTDGKYWEIVPNNVSSGSQFRINTVGNRSVYRRLSFAAGYLALYDTSDTWRADTPVTTSSVIRISLEGTALKIYKDGTLIYTFTDTLNAPLEFRMYFWGDTNNVSNGLTSGVVSSTCSGIRKIYSYNVATASFRLIKDFTGLSNVVESTDYLAGMNKSADDDMFSFCQKRLAYTGPSDCPYYLVWKRSANTVIAHAATSDVHQVHVDKSGRWLDVSLIGPRADGTSRV